MALSAYLKDVNYINKNGQKQLQKVRRRKYEMDVTRMIKKTLLT